MRLTGAPGLGCANIVALARARFDSRKLFSACSDHSIDALHLAVSFKKSLNGCRIFTLVAPGMKRL